MGVPPQADVLDPSNPCPLVCGRGGAPWRVRLPLGVPPQADVLDRLTRTAQSDLTHEVVPYAMAGALGRIERAKREAPTGPEPSGRCSS